MRPQTRALRRFYRASAWPGERSPALWFNFLAITQLSESAVNDILCLDFTSLSQPRWPFTQRVEVSRACGIAGSRAANRTPIL